jgi:hypothetical protein
MWQSSYQTILLTMYAINLLASTVMDQKRIRSVHVSSEPLLQSMAGLF